MAAEQQSPNDDPPEYAVADPEEFNQTQRLRTINEVRKQAGEAIQATMTQLRTEDDFDVTDRQQILRAAVYRYLTEIEWLAVKAEDNEILDEAEFGEVTLQPQDINELVNGQAESGVRVIGSPNLKPFRRPITGIRDYLTAPEVFEKTWTVQVDTRHSGPQPVKETRATYMPAYISLNAFRMANRFLSKNGIDVEIHESEGDAGFDYSDLLDEGPPGVGDMPEIEADGGQHE